MDRTLARRQREVHAWYGDRQAPPRAPVNVRVQEHASSANLLAVKDMDELNHDHAGIIPWDSP